MQVKYLLCCECFVFHGFIGDLFQRWTNDHWKSALHRVIHLEVDRFSGANEPSLNSACDFNNTSSLESSRYSLVFFTGPLEESIIECIDDELIEASTPSIKKSFPKYPPIKSHDHLLEKLNRTNKR
jgi:hypothetical protein